MLSWFSSHNSLSHRHYHALLCHRGNTHDNKWFCMRIKSISVIKAHAFKTSCPSSEESEVAISLSITTRINSVLGYACQYVWNEQEQMLSELWRWEERAIKMSIQGMLWGFWRKLTALHRHRTVQEWISLDYRQWTPLWLGKLTSSKVRTMTVFQMWRTALLSHRSLGADTWLVDLRGVGKPSTSTERSHVVIHVSYPPETRLQLKSREISSGSFT